MPNMKRIEDEKYITGLLNNNTITDLQKIISEKERLASLGSLIGGISHNLKTPLMSVSACISSLETLLNEYKDSIGHPSVRNEDHREIANDMSNWLGDLKKSFTYLGNAIRALKDHASHSELHKDESFTVNEIFSSIDFLMKFEIKYNNCSLEKNNLVGPEVQIKGDKGTLVQIINNLISNSIQSYFKKDNEVLSIGKKIEFNASESGNYVIFSVKDYGKGISKDVKDKIFKEMTTTKGKEGTGIGLLLSYSKVKEMFNGEMWFESGENMGAIFYIRIPVIK